MLVFVSHAGLKDLVPGGFGVTIFFVLSGYLITTLLRLEFEKDGGIDLRAFYLRRALRILPLLYIALSAALVLWSLGQLTGSISTLGVLSQILHWSNYYLIQYGPDAVVGGTIVLWSLAVEEHFYLIFPVFFHLGSRRLSRRSLGWLLASVCVACLIWRLILILALHQPGVRTELGTDTRFDGLLLGCLMAIVANPVKADLPRLSLRQIRWAAMLSIPLLLFTFLYRNEAFRETWRYSIQGLALLPLFTYVIKDRGSFVFRFLNLRWMTQLGALSYSLYLIHAIILDCFQRRLHAPKMVIAAAALATAVVIAKILQVAVEKPLLGFRKTLELRSDSGTRRERERITGHSPLAASVEK
jgi:peptidoglycan/LPS O-acetylase OafA/YrhL